MKYTLVLALNLVAAWMIWSGMVSVSNSFVLFLGGLSVLLSLWVCIRMKIDDDESVPLHFSWRIIPYGIYLIGEIITSNIAVAKIVLSRKPKLQRNMIVVHANQKTEIGNVVLANSVTLTPGTVSVNMHDKEILVHALDFAGAEEDLSGEMARRVSKLEGNS
jgi:multicomponent Na+:H+ antiporter subunit E